MNAVGSRVKDVTFYFCGDCEGETYVIDALYAGDKATVSVDCTPKPTGNSFATGVGITYEVSVTGISYEDSGIIRGTVE